MFGFPGGYGYPGLGMGQSIPPHPPSAIPPHPAVSSVTGGTSGQLRNGAGQPLHSPQGHLAGGQSGQTTGTAAQGNNQGYTTHNQEFNNQVEYFYSLSELIPMHFSEKLFIYWQVEQEK